jgi:hypothetical protein
MLLGLGGGILAGGIVFAAVGAIPDDITHTSNDSWVTGGAIAAVGGGALVIGGIVLLAKNRSGFSSVTAKSYASFSVAPRVARTYNGIAARVTF